MQRSMVTYGGYTLPCLTAQAVVVGSGCAALNAADCLAAQGMTDILLVTEDFCAGTSRNTGSDKQTYYKLSLCGEDGDSVGELARTLYAGGGVHGDLALAEAAGSVRCFMKLVEAGVPFPTNEYGEYAGYKTDHDPRQRATSAGPLTSRMMTEALARLVRGQGIPVLQPYLAVQVLTWAGRAVGLLTLNLAELDAPHRGWTLLCAGQLALATGGPASLYADRVYPHSQAGMSSLYLTAGAAADNLCHWQYGLASTDFRWNVSGTYQQVLPRYVLEDGREFLPQALGGATRALAQVFLKGYEWPFDSAKAGGSSQVDLAVAAATAAGHAVALDFTHNPQGFRWDALSPEARDYLGRSGARQDTPYARLQHMNPDAIQLYADHDIDLFYQPLHIAVCAQHANGGAAVDAHWQSTLPGLYVCGEAAGTFGLYRPGGSALNATQVGGLRAAEAMAAQRIAPQPQALQAAWPQILPWLKACEAGLKRAEGPCATALDAPQQRRMSDVAAQRRNPEAMADLLAQVRQDQQALWASARLTPRDLPAFVRALDRMETTQAVLSAMLCSAEVQGSCGPAVVEGRPPRPDAGQWVIRTVRTGAGYVSCAQPRRPLPQPDRWFETVWAASRARKGTP